MQTNIDTLIHPKAKEYPIFINSPSLVGVLNSLFLVILGSFESMKNEVFSSSTTS